MTTNRSLYVRAAEDHARKIEKLINYYYGALYKLACLLLGEETQRKQNKLGFLLKSAFHLSAFWRAVDNFILFFFFYYSWNLKAELRIVLIVEQCAIRLEIPWIKSSKKSMNQEHIVQFLECYDWFIDEGESLRLDVNEKWQCISRTIFWFECRISTRRIYL